MTGLTFVEFDDDQRHRWLSQSLADYIEERVASGDTREQAEAAARRAEELFFPEGKPAAGHLAGHVVADSGPVGNLWVGPHDAGSNDWWVWDVEIRTELRGQGLGRRAMQLAETLAIQHGAVTLGLNVFGFNTVARNLYESLGYEPTAIQLRKSLQTGPGDGAARADRR